MSDRDYSLEPQLTQPEAVAKCEEQFESRPDQPVNAKASIARHHGWEDGFPDGYAAYKGGDAIIQAFSIPRSTGYENEIPQVWCEGCYPKGYVSCLPQWEMVYSEGYSAGYKAGYAHAYADTVGVREALAKITQAQEAARQAQDIDAYDNAEILKRQIENYLAKSAEDKKMAQGRPKQSTQKADEIARRKAADDAEKVYQELSEAGKTDSAEDEASPTSSSTLMWVGIAAALAVGGYVLFSGKKPIIG